MVDQALLNIVRLTDVVAIRALTLENVQPVGDVLYLLVEPMGLFIGYRRKAKKNR